jgi:cell division protein FtsI/penicillin-binding protein 2
MASDASFRTDRRRLNALIFCLAFGFSVIVAQFFYRQILTHDRLRHWAENQRTWEEDLPAPRGWIADVNGHPLALNAIQWDISASPNLVSKPAELAGPLAELLDLPAESVYAALASEVRWVQLATQVDYETGEAVVDLEDKGIICEPRWRRFYPEGSLFAHVVGIVNDTGDGFYGVEGYFNGLLSGSSGSRLVERNPVGDNLPIPPLSESLPQAGTHLILTVDRNIQYIAEQELKRAIEEFAADSGTVLVADPQTGAILASVSLPTYDPNDFADADPDLLLDPSVSQLWEPGSIFKIITWAAALDSGTISPGTTFYDEGAREVGGRIIMNWDRQGRGLVTMLDGLVQSLNTAAAFASTSMGKDRFYTYLRRFGFGTLTNIDLDSEGPGMVKLPGDSNWFPSELGTNSFGQGIAVTPMQMVAAVSAVANRGMLMKPHIVHQLITEDAESGEKRIIQKEPMSVRWAVSQQTAETLTGMLVEVVERGATEAKVPGYRIAGKTGTAQIPTAYGYHTSDTIASFVGFAPADDPQFIVLVRLNRPKAAPWGSRTAAPTFRAIAKRLFAYLQIPPDEIRLAQR